MKIPYMSRIKFIVGTLFAAVSLTAAVWGVILGQARTANEAVNTVASPLEVMHSVYLPLLNDVPRYQRLPMPIYGIEMNDVSNQGGLQYIKAVQSTWVHVTAVWWPDVEGVAEGQRNWSSMAFLEQNFRNASSNGMKAIVVVRGTPSWAQKYQDWACGPVAQDKMVAFGNFIHDLVQRYSVPPYNVKYWELGNEPDVDHSLLTDKNSLFGCWGDKDDPYYGGRYYAEMLKVAYPRIKQADPNSQVLLGGLLLDCDPRLPLDSATGCHSEANRIPSNFLEGILLGGGAPFFNGISFHAYDWYPRTGQIGAYSNPNWLSRSSTTGPSVLSKVDFIQSVLMAYGVTDKYLMNTEIALLCGKCTSSLTEPLRINFEKTKAYLAAQVYPQAIISGLSTSLWFRNMDLGSANFFYSSMFNDDITARLVYTAFAAAHTYLGNASYERPLSPADIGEETDLRGYSFIREDGKHVWTVWSITDTTKILTLPAMPAGAYNQTGEPMSVAANHQLELTSPDSLYSYIVWDH